MNINNIMRQAEAGWSKADSRKLKAQLIRKAKRAARRAGK